MKCKHCQKEFEPKDKRQVFCSKSCAIQRWYANNITKVREDNLRYYHSHKSRAKETMHLWYKKNRQKQLAYMKEYNLSRKDKKRQYDMKYRQDNKEVRHKNYLEWQKNRIINNKEFRMKKRLQALLRYAFKSHKAVKEKCSSKYGINFDDIIKHLEPFPEDIVKYHIDHIRPLCSFSFVTDSGEVDTEEIKKAFAPENHQWLLAKDNIMKNGKWENTND
jgi:hypothetical protein